MIVKQYTDPVAAVEALLFESFQKVFQNEDARRHFGFSQISQPTTDEGFPSWYIWFSAIEGVYSITIPSGYVIPNDSHAQETAAEDDAVAARLLIKYFPGLNEEIFNSLSCYEQIYRMNGNFDDTGTPSFEGGRAMHESCFVVGHIDITVHSSRKDADFFCFAPDRWRDYRKDGLKLTDANGQLQEVLTPGSVDRDLPGWDLSFFLFDKIISAFCFSTAQSPRFTGAATKPAHRYVIDAMQNVSAIDDADITDTVVGVCFTDDLQDGVAVRNRQAFFEKELTASNGCLTGIWNNYKDIPEKWQKPEWWSIRNRHFHTDLDHLCSCYTDH